MPLLRSHRNALALAVATLCFGSATAAARADDASYATTGTGVARLSLVAGDVDVQRGDATEQTAGVINAPLEGGDYLTTGDDSACGEVQFTNVTQLRLDRDTQIRFSRIDDGVREVQVAQGTVELALLRGTDGNSQIDTPSISIVPRDRGDYRVTVNADGSTTFTVRAGRADVITPGGTQTLNVNQTLYAQGPATAPTTNVTDAIAFDDFDKFNGDRDRAHDRALASAVWNNDYVDGVDDLYRYGRWVNDPAYGTIWVPYASNAGWAPYQNGRWVWEAPYGWTWVAYEPWGWAPYHYGRWFFTSYGWAWYPPASAFYAPLTVYRPPVVYQPALVAFFTFGGGSGQYGFGNVGWVPLGPGEVYRPWYAPFHRHGSPTTVVQNTYNITNITNITSGNVTKIYVNANAPGAVTTVTSRRFADGDFSQTHALPAAQVRNLPNAAAVAGALPLAPTARNLAFGTHPAALQSAPPGTPPSKVFVGHTFAGKSFIARPQFEVERPILESAVRPLATAAGNASALPATHAAAFRDTTVNAPSVSHGVAQPLPERSPSPQAPRVHIEHHAGGYVAPQYFSQPAHGTESTSHMESTAPHVTATLPPHPEGGEYHASHLPRVVHTPKPKAEPKTEEEH